MYCAVPRSTASRIVVTLLLATWATAARAETVRVLPPDKLPDDKRLGAAGGSERLLPLHAAENARRVGPAGRAGAAAGAGGHRPLADAHQDARPRRRPRPGRPRRLHRREGLLRELSRPFRHRQPLSAQGHSGQAAGRALSARALAQRPLLRRRARRSSAGRSSEASRAVRARRPLSAPGPLRAAGPHGLRRLPLRHGRLCRQRAVGAPPRHPPGDEHAGELGLLQPAGRGPAAEHDGPADLQLDPGAGLVQRAARRRPASGSP